MGDGHRRMLLHVVGRQPMIFRTDEGLEKRPSLARQCAEEVRLGRGQPGRAAREGLTRPPGQERAGEPNGQDGRGQG